MLQYWQDPNFPAFALGLPVCGSFCDAVFEACKNDRFCMKNQQGGFLCVRERACVSVCVCVCLFVGSACSSVCVCVCMCV